MKKIIRNHQKNIANAFYHTEYRTIKDIKCIDRNRESFGYNDFDYYTIISYDNGVLYNSPTPVILCSCLKVSRKRKSRAKKLTSSCFSVVSNQYIKNAREYRDGMYKSYEQLMVSL